MKRVLCSALLLGSIALARPARASEAKEGFGSLTVDQVESLIAKKEADIYDNNSKERWQQSHVPSAKWVAFDEVKSTDLPNDKDRKLVFYCANTH